MVEQLGLSPWQTEVLTSLLIVVAAVAVSFLVVIIVGLAKRHIAKRTKTELDDQILDAMKRPLHVTMILVGLAVAVQRLEGRFPEVSEWVFKTTDQMIIAAIIVVVAWFLLKLARILTVHMGRRDTDDESSPAREFSPLLNRMLKVLIMVLAALMVLDHFEVDIKGLVAVLGVGSLAIALAAQDSVANTIAGFIIMMDRPFRVGDRIILPSGEKADVYEIGLRSSKFLTFEQTLVVVPNQELVTSTITNLAYPREEIRVAVDVGVAYGSDIDQVKSILVRVADENPTVLKQPEPAAYFLNFGDSSLDFGLRCRVAEVSQQFGTGEQLRCAIYHEFNQAGIEIPFPQHDVHLIPVAADGEERG